MKQKIFLISLAFSFMFMACTNEEVSTPEDENNPGITEPGEEVVADSAVVLKASINGMKYSGSRSTIDGNWAVEDTLVAVKIGDEVKKYSVDSDGYLTSDTPFYWGDNDKLTIEAWYPYNEGVKQTEILVKQDQSVPENLIASDYLEVLPVEVEMSYPRISFSHRVSKLVFTISVANGSSKGAALKILNVAGVEGGNDIVASSDNVALLAPQTILQGTDFLNIDLQSGLSAVYTVENDLVFEQGYMYMIKVSISEIGSVNMEILDRVDWVGNDEQLDGDASAINPGTGNGGWGDTGDEENMDSDSSTVNPDTGNGGWNGSGDDENMDSDSSVVSPGTDNDGWENSGDDENMDSDSSVVGPGTDNDGWENSGNDETVGSDSSDVDVTPGNGNNSGWENSGDGETVGSDSSDVDITPGNGNNSGWTGTEDEKLPARPETDNTQENNK